MKQHKDDFLKLLTERDHSSMNFFEEALKEDVKLFLTIIK